jgi:hypothetical protein
MIQQDQVHEYLLARIAAVETWLMLIWNQSEHRDAIKADAQKFIEAREAVSLHETTSDEVLAIQKVARQASFEAVFRELLSEKDMVALRSLQGRSQSGE